MVKCKKNNEKLVGNYLQSLQEDITKILGEELESLDRPRLMHR
jgi:hypothetical protein